MKTNRKKLTTKIALTVGVLLLIVWSILGTSASLAWFSDESPVMENIFNFAEFDLEVQYRNRDMTEYAPLEMESNVFLDDALYEPGYSQVVYLKVINKGTVAMKYKVSVDVRNVTAGTSVLGNPIYLPNYLRYGVIFADAETILDREIAQQKATEDMADLDLNHFTDSITVAPEGERYVALIVVMPTDVGNAANYRGDIIPTIDIGLTVFAEQVK